MAKPNASHQIVLSPAARQDIRDILLWSLQKFGRDASQRYRELLIHALRDLTSDPERPGSRARPELEHSARTYHLALSRSSVPSKRVKAPRHFILYRIRSTGIEIGRILHDSRDLLRHLPADYPL